MRSNVQTFLFAPQFNFSGSLLIGDSKRGQSANQQIDKKLQCNLNDKKNNSYGGSIFN